MFASNNSNNNNMDVFYLTNSSTYYTVSPQESLKYHLIRVSPNRDTNSV